MIPAKNHSYSNSDDISIQHVDLILTIYPENNVFSGVSTYIIEPQKPKKSQTLILDTRDIVIEDIATSADKKKFDSAEFSLSDRNAILGQALTIQLSADSHYVRIKYRINISKQNAIIRMRPPLSLSQHFLLTLACPIRARNLLPCQDTPAVKFTFTARINTSPNYLAVMAADNNPTAKSANGQYEFTTKQPIPAYLFALAIADLEYLPFDENTGIYAEVEILEDAFEEFMIFKRLFSAAKQILGEYHWQRYDLLVLPPSFPYGGMENPQLSFISAVTMSNHDSNIQAKLAHEIAHAWFGNLITPLTWSDVWLSEGAAVYMENRIIELVYGQYIAEMEAYLKYAELVIYITEKKASAADQILCRKLTSRDPECMFDLVSYNKGFLFFKALEKYVGRNNFDAFLRYYIMTFKAANISTSAFIDFLRDYIRLYKLETVGELNIDEWLYQPGLPNNANELVTAVFQPVANTIEQWLQKKLLTIELLAKGWGSQQWLFCLQYLINKPLNLTQMSELDKIFHFSESSNAKLAQEWFILVIHNQYEEAYTALQLYLNSLGAISLVYPLYEKMIQAGLKKLAYEFYQQAKIIYHPILCALIEKKLFK